MQPRFAPKQTGIHKMKDVHFSCEAIFLSVKIVYLLTEKNLVIRRVKGKLHIKSGMQDVLVILRLIQINV